MARVFTRGDAISLKDKTDAAKRLVDKGVLEALRTNDDRGVAPRPKPKKKTPKPGELETAGLGVADKAVLGALGSIPGAGEFAKIGVRPLLALAHDPVGVPKKTALAVPPTIKGIIGGAAEMLLTAADDPAMAPYNIAKDLAEGTAEDVKRRYGGTTAQQVARMRREGVLPEVLDTTLVVGAPVAAGGRVLGRAGAAGKLGPKAETLMTTQRPLLRTRQGKGGAQPQPQSPNLFTRSVQAKRDARRQRLFDERRKAAKAPGGKPYQGLVPEQRQWHPPNVVDPGEVVRATRWAQNKRLGKDTSGTFTQGSRAIRAAQDTEIRRDTGLRGGRSRAHKGLNKREEKLFDELQVHGLQGLIDYDNPERRFELLTKHRAEVDENLKAHPDVDERLPDVDVAADIDRALKRAEHEKVDTDKVLARLRTFHEEEASRAGRMEATSDVRRARDARVRRFAPVARTMGDPYIREIDDIEARPDVHAAELRRLENDKADIEAAIVRGGKREAYARGAAKAPAAKADRRAKRDDPEYRKASSAVVRTRAKKKAANVDFRNTQRRQWDRSDQAARDDIRRAEERVRLADEAHEQALATLKEVDKTVQKRAQWISGMGARAGTTSATRMEPFGPKGQRTTDPVEEYAAKSPLAGLGRKPEGLLARVETERGKLTDFESRLADKEREIKEHKASAPTQAELDTARRAAEDAMVERVSKARGDLPEPVYVQHRPHATKGFGAYTAASARAMVGSRRNRFSLYDTGRYVSTPEAYEQGIARSIKNEVNWNTNTDLYERHAPPWNEGNAADPRVFHSVKSAIDRVASLGLDLREWVPVDVSVVRRAAAADLNDPDSPSRATAMGDADVTDFSEYEPIIAALNDATGSGMTLASDGVVAKFANTQGFMLVPKAVDKEIKAQMTPAGKGWRAMGKLTGVTSRWILATNPLYVPANLASNTITGAAATRGRAFTGAGHRWYRNLPPKSREWVDKFAGLDSPAFDMGAPQRMGSTWDNRFVEAYHAFIDGNIVRKAARGHFNPLTWNRTLDSHQNNWWRKEVFYDKLRREARDNMVRDINGVIRELPDIMKALETPDDDIMAKLSAMREAEPAFERAAELTDDALGNWTRFTAAERRG